MKDISACQVQIPKNNKKVTSIANTSKIWSLIPRINK